jgi:hypothetical protein
MMEKGYENKLQEIPTKEAGQKILRLVLSYWLRTGLTVSDVKGGGAYESCAEWRGLVDDCVCDLPNALL